MPNDYVDLDPQRVANGLGVWDQAAGTLQSRIDDLSAAITDSLGRTPWGADEPGARFAREFAEPAAKFTSEGATIEGSLRYFAKEVTETGQKVRSSCEASLGADELQAKEVNIKVPRFNA